MRDDDLREHEEFAPERKQLIDASELKSKALIWIFFRIPVTAVLLFAIGFGIGAIVPDWTAINTAIVLPLIICGIEYWYWITQAIDASNVPKQIDSKLQRDVDQKFEGKLREVVKVSESHEFEMKAGDIELGTAQMKGFEAFQQELRDANDTGLDDFFHYPLRLRREERNRHLYVIGKTRMGKTTMLANMCADDIKSGQGVCFIDPHGDAAQELLNMVPEERLGDVIYFDPTQMIGTPAFNPLSLQFPPAKLTEDVISVFQMLVGDSWGPRMEHMLRYAVLTLITSPDPHTIRDIRTLFIDEARRNRIIEKVVNPSIREFWESEYPLLPSNAVNPILNKLSSFLAPTSDLERVFSNPVNELDFTAILNDSKILIVNLSKGILGDESARLLGGMIVTGIQQAGLGRATMPIEARKDFFLYVDEFQNFTVASFPTILAESAKYRLNLILAHQNLAQVSTHMQRSIFGNCGTMIAYQISSQDASLIGREMNRSDISVRHREQSDSMTVDTFVREMRMTIQTEMNSPDYGLSRSAQLELDHHRDQADLAETEKQIESTTFQRTKILTDRKNYLDRAQTLLEDQDPSISALAELFTDYVFESSAFPTTEDFVNLPPYEAIVKHGFENEVSHIRATPPYPPLGSRDRLTKLLAETYTTKPLIELVPELTQTAHAEKTQSPIAEATDIEIQGPSKPVGS